jgi:signal transduction histidine kinase
VKKSIWIFLLAVLVPSVVLGWLALRSASEQQIILERRTAELYQKETEAVAAAARTLIDDERRAFNNAVQQLLAKEEPAKLARSFAVQLSKEWQRKAVGFALGADGKLISPSASDARNDLQCQQFLLNNSGFLSGRMAAEVYWVSADELNRAEVLRGNTKSKASNDNKLAAEQQSPMQQRAQVEQSIQVDRKRNEPPPAPAAAAAPMPEQRQSDTNAKDMAQVKAIPAQQQVEKAASKNAFNEGLKQEAMVRNVAPQRVIADNQPNWSQLMPSTADFRALTSDSTEGVVTRFVQDRLEILFWVRPPQAPDLIFGCLVEADALRDIWAAAFPDRTATRESSIYRPNGTRTEFVLALLDDKARPVASQPAGEVRDWKRPFVASEVGEALPHWEAALYLMRPQQLQESARSVRRTLIFLIATALGAIACGGWLVFADARRQLALAQKKTDFVSNVSHELKTPLTSIRMFAELMHNGHNVAEDKRSQYLRIIMVEAERLTRLINNVLDFARIERRQKRYDKRPLDLHGVIERTWESHELHLRGAGFTTRWQAAPPPYPVTGDEDALAQVLVNLLSNAEKYCGERKDIELHSYLDAGHVCVSVLDRGSGVPAGEERKIFEAFYRAHDSLSSGIQGSGLGLTLAARLAIEHGGEITYAPREGGGSNFTLKLPLAAHA